MIQATLESVRTPLGATFDEISLGHYNFMEIQDGWLYLFAGPEGATDSRWIIDNDPQNHVRVWRSDGDIKDDNWIYEARRLNILPSNEPAQPAPEYSIYEIPVVFQISATSHEDATEQIGDHLATADLTHGCIESWEVAP